jgi:hypothetical protein
VIVDQPQDSKEMTAEVIVDQPQDSKEMTAEVIVDQPQDSKEMTAEVIVDQPQDSKEMITEAHTVKKVVNPLSSKRNLEVSKRNLSKNQQRNPLFNLNNFCH